MSDKAIIQHLLSSMKAVKKYQVEEWGIEVNIPGIIRTTEKNLISTLREWAGQRIDKIEDPSYGSAYGYVSALEALLDYLDELEKGNE